MQLAVLQNLLESEKALRCAAETETQATHKALESLARDLAGDVVDTLTKQNNQGLAYVTSDVLAERIGRAVQTELAHLRRQITTTSVPATPASLLEAECQRWQQIVADNETEIAQLQEKIASLQAAEKAGRKPPNRDNETAPLPIDDFAPYSTSFTPAALQGIWPDWFRKWIIPHAGLDKDFTLIQILGKTGEPYRATVTKAAAYYLGMKSIGGSLGKSITRLEEMGMVTLIKVNWQRIHPHLVALTDKGENAYRMLFEQEPVPQELPRLLARHKSALHTYLILETDRRLRAAGYEVERYPDPLETEDISRYEPDLVARLDGCTLYIEAEVRTAKSRGKNSDRRRKWERYWKLTGGEFYVSVMDAAACRSLLSELRYWASILEQQAVVWIMEAGGRRGKTTGWDVWERAQVG